MLDNTPLIDIDEDNEETLIEYLTEFEEKLWPIFKARGYSKDTALIVWQLNRLNNNICDLADDNG